MIVPVFLLPSPQASCMQCAGTEGAALTQTGQPRRGSELRTHQGAGKKFTNAGDESFAILDRFEERKPTILANLRNIHQQGPSTQPFDEKGASNALKFFSCSYVAWAIARKQTRPSPDIRERFKKLSVDMEQVRLPLDELWDRGELSYVIDAGRRIGVDVIQEMLASLNSLAALETAFSEACKHIPLKRGRPRDRALRPAEVRQLAEVYAESTGCKPGSGKGPFARFVYAVLSALGQSVSEDHVIDVIKGAHLARGKKSSRGKKSKGD
jgi:hypothetical protein